MYKAVNPAMDPVHCLKEEQREQRIKLLQELSWLGHVKNAVTQKTFQSHCYYYHYTLQLFYGIWNCYRTFLFTFFYILT